MKRAQRAAAVVGSVSAAGLITGAMFASIPAQAAGASAGDWRIIAAVHYGAGGNASGYSAVVAVSKDDAWVFGGTNPGGTSSPAAENWNGTGWRSSALPAGLGGFIAAADASSARNVWAVGDGYALRWNGARWSVAKTWPQTGQLTSVAAVNRNDVWVFGASPFGGGAGLGTWHFNGRAWIRARGIANSIYRASAVARHDIWAITAGPRGGSVVRYNGHAWTRVSAARAALANTQLDSVLAMSRTSVWVSGTTPADGQNARLVLAHWNGSRWTRFVAPWNVEQPERFAPDGTGGIWIPVVTGGQDPATWILHLSQAGKWSRTQIAADRAAGVGIGDLALIPGTTSLWGSGGLLTPTGGDATIWAHQDIHWIASTSVEAQAGVAIIRKHAIAFHGPMQRAGAAG
jgi:hypothetical protein